MKNISVRRIVIVKARFSVSCSGDDCHRQIEKGTLCHARRPGEEYFCPGCAAERKWPPIDRKNFVDPLKASKQGAGEVKMKRKNMDTEDKNDKVDGEAQAVDKDS